MSCGICGVGGDQRWIWDLESCCPTPSFPGLAIWAETPPVHGASSSGPHLLRAALIWIFFFLWSCLYKPPLPLKKTEISNSASWVVFWGWWWLGQSPPRSGAVPGGLLLFAQPGNKTRDRFNSELKQKWVLLQGLRGHLRRDARKSPTPQG